uniref:Uncharacterized protein n=1 Tax=Brassica oleracea var. oleracea TaxID=109376 RepID=A0A0D3C113_BRAOL
MPGGDRNKKPQEEEEEVKTSFAHIPYDLTKHCLAITPRRHYPNLSLASKSFRRILRSPELYQRRSTLGVTKPVLYASIGFPSSETPSWHTLHRDHVSFRLRKIASLPSRLLSAVATVGTEMYVLGGSVGGNPTSDVNLIDCRFHTSRSLPSMKRTRSRAVAGAIDGKVYVIGGCRKKSDDWVEAFDVKTVRDGQKDFRFGPECYLFGFRSQCRCFGRVGRWRRAYESVASVVVYG